MLQLLVTCSRDQFSFTESSFPNVDGLIAIFPNSTGHWPSFEQKGRKIPGLQTRPRQTAQTLIRLLHSDQGLPCLLFYSDFICDFRKLPFSSPLWKYLFKKISAKIHENGKIKVIFGLGMTPIYGHKN